MTARALKIIALADDTSLIRRFVLAPADGTPLPGFAAGAHITIEVPGVGQRKYSLVNPVALSGGTAAPRAYILGIRRDDPGEGGSRYMHALQVGDTLSVTGPANDFAVVPGDSPVLLIGGGIGITPLISMAAEMRGLGRPFRMIYAVRTRAEMAFRTEIEALCGPGLVLHCDDEAGRVLDIDATLAGLAPDVTVYACGPKPMLKAAVQAARKLKWPPHRLKFELFYSVAKPAPAAANTGMATPAAATANGGVAPPPAAFEVQLKSSGRTITVPADKSILDALLEAGVDAMHDCKKGECGVCQTGVVEGIPDHRDHVLSAADRASNKVMQICVSRSKSPRLILDL